jgi:putative FmdB family regulatory protein
MIYEYECEKCHLTKEVFRHHNDDVEPVECDMCGKEMVRFFRPIYFKVSKGYYNHGLGIKVSHPNDVRDEIKRVRDKTGLELIETGNEDIRKYAEKKKKENYSSYELSRDEYKIAERILNESTE